MADMPKSYSRVVSVFDDIVIAMLLVVSFVINVSNLFGEEVLFEHLPIVILAFLLTTLIMI